MIEEATLDLMWRQSLLMSLGCLLLLGLRPLMLKRVGAQVAYASWLLIPLLLGKPLGAEVSAMVTFTLFEAAYYSEIMRAGIQSVPKGQTSAGQAVGMTYPQTMQYIVLPQAFRNMLPVLLTQTIILFQDTSLVYAIGAYDLLKGFEIAGKNFNRPVETYLVAAVVYFVICFSLSMLVRRLQKKIAIIR